jgi:predicted small integral membrane protein
LTPEGLGCVLLPQGTGCLFGVIRTQWLSLSDLGGLIGLGGAEFRLPLLISLFRFRGLEAVILNKATSLVVVAAALPFRASTVSFAELGGQWRAGLTGGDAIR